MKRGQARELGVLVLAAGAGTRMASVTPKVLHPIGGRPMIFHVLRAANALKPAEIGVVVGHQGDAVKSACEAMARDGGVARPLAFVRQKEPKGSADAVMTSLSFLKKFKTAVVLCADAPLITYESLYALLRLHQEQKNQVTFLTARVRNPRGYGRVVRSPLGEVLRIVEDAVASSKELLISEVNSGVYCFETSALAAALKAVSPKGPKKEFFLTDVLEVARASGGRIGAHLLSSPEEIGGVNTRVQLAEAQRRFNRRMLERLMLSGVTVVDPASTCVDADVEVGRDSVIWPGTVLRGRTKIGRGCVVGPHCLIDDSEVGAECEIEMSRLLRCRVLEKTRVGPFAHIRADSVLGPRARVGNFSELKATRLGAGSKVNHLSYVGDADVKEDVNIGAGTITCNFDGRAKHKTTIEARAFIGSNATIVAPLRVGRGALVAAGSTIDADVPAGALAFGRARQENKPGRAKDGLLLNGGRKIAGGRHA
ncbi:MAG: bifunctional UDP-N-acetylglucosamine diphosphorylase/glucosamine-1-phosphate N-acetyltransferase GlmU [Elusimicrobia bacterium]|nr:bifunctional UDP-N-acetylglucosamine diphosphorylase/glucosamine-1-phosphate N-acetyltransferase GlmU [Elusimicrobiota bacterium]MDE2313117.1 bifunctional UDP-N-acetylglucosamine diphosphorylase/glucosamine-1-phosphate N-acetyltransferase GlmU [Elusimicrobiota bacterium]